MMKIMKIVRRLHFIAQKKRPDALNATQKIPDPYKVWFLKKSRKTCKKNPSLLFWSKIVVFFKVFLNFLRNRTMYTMYTAGGTLVYFYFCLFVSLYHTFNRSQLLYQSQF